MLTTIYWSFLHFENWDLYLGATDKGLAFVGSNKKGIDELRSWADKQFKSYELVHNEERLQSYQLQLMEYLQGDRMAFTLPLDHHGTHFQKEVWQCLSDIPYGETRTYSDIASQMNRSRAARAVGTAIGANPLLISIPCHRVLGKNGSLTGYRGGLDMKSKLLELEKRSQWFEKRNTI